MFCQRTQTGKFQSMADFLFILIAEQTETFLLWIAPVSDQIADPQCGWGFGHLRQDSHFSRTMFCRQILNVITVEQAAANR